MRNVVLITGGCRSGKSARALVLGESMPGPRSFIATCPRLDQEMDERIARHQQERSAGGWQTLECETDLVGAIDALVDVPVILIDCLSLWVNNLLFTAKDSQLDESGIASIARGVLQIASQQNGLLLVVTNEVGLGIVPDNALARRYRDLLGRCNQVFAQSANRVELMVAGFPLTVKESEPA